MTLNHHRLCLALIALSALPAQAGWLTITNPPVSNQITLAPGNTHQLTFSSITGSATVETLSATGTGIFVLRSYPHYNPTTFDSYPANGLDPNGADQFVVGDSGGSGNAVNVRFDFTGLAGGVLPAGSVFTVLDLDVLEALSHLQAFDSGGSQIVTPWLSLIASFDADNNSSVGPTDYATEVFSGGEYNFISPSGNTDIPTLYYVTTQALSSFNFEGVSEFGPRGYGLGINAVPEPGSYALVGGALALAGLYRRRRLLSHGD